MAPSAIDHAPDPPCNIDQYQYDKRFVQPHAGHTDKFCQNIGLALLQNVKIYCASSLQMRCPRYNSAVVAAPNGYPDNIPTTTA